MWFCHSSTGRGNFNKKRISAVKERKVKQRVEKKRKSIKQKHDKKKAAVSGLRTGAVMPSMSGGITWQPLHIVKTAAICRT